MKLVALRVVWIAFEIAAVRLRRPRVLVLGVATETNVTLLYTLLAHLLRALVVVQRRHDERILSQLFGFSLLLGVVHVGIPPPAALNVFGQLGAGRDGAVELVVHLMRHGDLVEDLGDSLMLRPLPDRQTPSCDGLGVLGFVEVDLAELEVDLRCPIATLRQEVFILNALEAGRATLGRIGNLVLVPIVVREGDAKVLDRLGPQL